MLRPLALAALLLWTSGFCGAAELKLAPLWTTNVQTFLESAPTVADLNGDGSCEVLIAGREELIALDRSGQPLWRWHTKGRFMTYPAVCTGSDHPAWIYAADTSGLLTCLDGSGKVVWQAQLKAGSSWSSAVVADLNRDGACELIQTDESGTVWAFEARTGKVLWQASLKGLPVSPAVGDVDGDGQEEIAVATNAGQLALLSSRGVLRWERTVSGPSETWATSAPVIFGASDGRGRIAVGANDSHVRCFDADGHEVWSRETRGSVASSLSVGDMDHDGHADLFAITQTGVIYRFGEDGRELWNIDMQGRTLAAGALLELENDGRLDFVVSTQSGRMMVFNDGGEKIFEHQFPCRTINMTPAFGDVTPQSAGLELVVTGGESGQVFCFGTPAACDAPPSARPWISYRGDNHKSGAWLGLAQSREARMLPRDASWNHLASGDPIVFTIRVPETKDLPLKATATCVRPDGSRQSAMSPVYGAEGELTLPLDIVRPGRYGLSWSVTDSQGRKLAGGEHTLFLEPFANDRALVRRTLATLASVAERVAPTLPLAASALRREALALEQEAREVTPLQEAMPGVAGAAEQTTLRRSATLVRSARRAAGLAAAVDAARALGPGTSLLAFETTLWESGAIDAQLPPPAIGPLKIARRVVPGEHDPVSVKLLNVTDRELQVRVQVQTAAGGPRVVPLRSIAVPTKQGGVAWDPLVELDEAAVLSIPALATREVWLDARFDQVKPGEHQVVVHFQALNGAGVLEGPTSARDVPAPEAVAEIGYRVLPLVMAPEGVFRLCCWASYGPGTIADLLDHGNNVFCVPSSEAQYDAQGQLVGFDYTKMDALLAPLRGHDVVALVQGTFGLKPPVGSPPYAAELKRCLADLVDHLAQRGLDTDHFALYPYDEPGGAGWNAVNALAEFGQQVKAVAPQVKLYVDGGGELAMFQKLAPVIDIWCPGISMLAESSPEMELIRGTHRELWSYDCAYGYANAMRASLKDTNIVAEYRTAPLFALRWNATGIGFWCYNVGADAWQRMADDYPMVYPGLTKPVSSRRWEAVREGIEDFRILTALRQSEATLKDAALKNRLRHLFEVALPEFTDRSFQEMTVGLGRPAFAESKNDAVLAQFRQEMFDCLEAVCQEQAGR